MQAESLATLSAAEGNKLHKELVNIAKENFQADC